MTIDEKIQKARKHLEIWENAEIEVAQSQSYTIGSRSMTKANLSEIREQIKYYENKLAKLLNIKKKRGRNTILQVIPRDL